MGKKTGYIIIGGSKRVDTLYDGSNSYKIEDCLGRGKFGEVVQCLKSGTKEKMAVKVMGENLDIFAERELETLEQMKKLHGDKYNLVKFSHHFIAENRFCLAFEKLDMCLHNMMSKRHYTPLKLYQIRVIAQQMLEALNALKSIEIIHTDIKPDNIMLVNHESYPFKVKLIDFGNALPVSEIAQGDVIQIIGYRAPELYLGLPLNEEIDMWALGCVLAFLYLGKDLHPLDSEYEAMKVITQMHGQPDDQTLNSGLYTKEFFTKNEDSPTAPWKLYTRDEYISINHSGFQNKPFCGFSTNFTSLGDITRIHSGKKKSTEYEDNQAFLSLLGNMLQVDPKNRITPIDALGHRFITMKHFPKDIKDKYVKKAFSTVDKCMLWQPSEIRSLVTSSKVGSQKEEDNTRFDETHLAYGETTAEGSNGQPATDYASAAGDHNKVPERADAKTSSYDSHGPQHTDGVDKTTAAGAEITLHDSNVLNPPSSCTLPSNGVNISHEKGPSKVKKWKRWFRNLAKMFCCKTVDVIE